MEWEHVLTILGGNLAMLLACLGTTISLFVWSNRQARADFLHIDRKLDDHKREVNQIIKAIEEATRAMQEETRDFHNRLCTIEERNRSK